METVRKLNLILHWAMYVVQQRFRNVVSGATCIAETTTQIGISMMENVKGSAGGNNLTSSKVQR